MVLWLFQIAFVLRITPIVFAVRMQVDRSMRGQQQRNFQPGHLIIGVFPAKARIGHHAHFRVDQLEQLLALAAVTVMPKLEDVRFPRNIRPVLC